METINRTFEDVFRLNCTVGNVFSNDTLRMNLKNTRGITTTNCGHTNVHTRNLTGTNIWSRDVKFTEEEISTGVYFKESSVGCRVRVVIITGIFFAGSVRCISIVTKNISSCGNKSIFNKVEICFGWFDDIIGCSGRGVRNDTTCIVYNNRSCL